MDQLEHGGCRERYLVDALMRACDLMEAFRDENEVLRLRDLVNRTGMNKSTAFRLLCTLEHRGLVERSGPQAFRLRIKPLQPRKYRFGYATQSSSFAFAHTVTESLIRATSEEGIDLLILDNRYSSKTAVRNAETFVREKVDLVIDFQTDGLCAPIIAARILGAGIPLIAVEIPHPGAVFFGVDNYRAGLTGGRHLGLWAKRHWDGEVDEILALQLARSGAVVQSRLRGVVDGIHDVLPDLGAVPVTFLDGDGQFAGSWEAVRGHLRKTASKRVLVGCVNDPSALGALRAFEEAGKPERCAVIGMGACPHGRAELRAGGTRLVGSVGFFPEKYGREVLSLAMNMLTGKSVPPAVFVKHQMITAGNMDRHYPNDTLLNSSELDAALFQSPRRP